VNRMKLWNVAAKVPNVDAEVTFIKSLGGSIVLDEVLRVDEHDFRLVLAKLGDKYVHLFEHAVYEHRLDRPIENGLCHVVFEVDDLAHIRRCALDAGARETMPPAFISAGFGTRDVIFLESPGGILMEFVKVHKHGVPELP
jgi:catechol 2,3-dioxygenase-like lactoylglutathione lyase family enzyme